MLHPQYSRKKAQTISLVLFFIGLIGLTITQVWWPGIMLAVGIPLALRQYLLGHLYDMGITLLVFLGTFITVEFDISWRIFLPILLTLGAIYVLAKEFMIPEEISEKEKEEDIQHELEEEK